MKVLPVGPGAKNCTQVQTPEVPQGLSRHKKSRTSDNLSGFAQKPSSQSTQKEGGFSTLPKARALMSVQGSLTARQILQAKNEVEYDTLPPSLYAGPVCMSECKSPGVTRQIL